MLILHLGAFLGCTRITKNTVYKFKNILRTLWGWLVTEHPLNKNPISLTSEIMCSYMRVFTVFQSATREEKTSGVQGIIPWQASAQATAALARATANSRLGTALTVQWPDLDRDGSSA